MVDAADYGTAVIVVFVVAMHTVVIGDIAESVNVAVVAVVMAVDEVGWGEGAAPELVVGIVIFV